MARATSAQIAEIEAWYRLRDKDAQAQQDADAGVIRIGKRD